MDPTRLEQAVWDLSTRGLVHSARWAAEALSSVQAEPSYAPPALPARTLLAKSYFDCKEYDRCWHTLKDSVDPLSVFLRLYARYISGERYCDVKPTEKKEINPHLTDVLKEVQQATQATRDPFLLYLNGILLKKQSQEKAASLLFIESLGLYPLNWGCWQELLSCFKNINDASGVLASIPPSTERKLFELYCKQEFFQPEDAIAPLLKELRGILPGFLFLDVQEALMLVHNVNYDRAEQLFEQILASDPYRLEELDLYSNLLYVTEQRAKLSLLAQKAVAIDRYRVESCCIVANYYSLRGEHEVAADYYQRGLTSNPNYLSAWTLMGHEYVEMKNTHAAIEAYRTAVTISKRDFRAWYGLGQAYEVLDMASYAQYYYQRALALSPSDTRIWGAMGHCYEKMQNIAQAIRTYEQGLEIRKSDSYFHFRLGDLYEQQGDAMLALAHYEACAEENEDDSDSFRPQALLWLARYASRAGRWIEAKAYAQQIVESDFASGHEEDARGIIQEALYHVRERP